MARTVVRGEAESKVLSYCAFGQGVWVANTSIQSGRFNADRDIPIFFFFFFFNINI